jgi:hypothetical protein
MAIEACVTQVQIDNDERSIRRVDFKCSSAQVFKCSSIRPPQKQRHATRDQATGKQQTAS